MSNDDFFSLEINDSNIKIFDGEVFSKDIEVKKISYIDNLPSSFFNQGDLNISQKFANIIKKLISDLKINKRKVNIIIPDTYTYSQILKMPILNEKELISAIKYQADQFIPLPIEEINIDLEIIQQNEKEKTLLVLVAAISKKLAEKIEETVESAGLIPIYLENQLSAFNRFVNKFSNNLLSEPYKKIFFINLEKNSTSFYFFSQDNSVISKIHTFNIGYDLFFKEIIINTSLDEKKIIDLFQKFDVKDQEDFSIKTILSPVIKQFAFEIKKTIIPPALAFFIGEIVKFPLLARILGKEIDNSISFSIFNPDSIFKQNPQIENYKNKLSFFLTTIGGKI